MKPSRSAASSRDVLAQGVDDVIVVDNGSTDDTAERAAAAGATVVREPQRGYGRACAAGVAALPPATDIVCFLDGDGSDVPQFLPAVVGPIADGKADFVMGSRLRGRREPGSMTPQQIVAGWLAGVLMRLTYGVTFTDMSPFRAMRVDRLRALGMSEQTYGWNLEMQMRAAAARLAHPRNSRRSSLPPRRRLQGVGRRRRRPQRGLEDHDHIPAPCRVVEVQTAADRRPGSVEMKALLTGGAGFIGQHVIARIAVARPRGPRAGFAAARCSCDIALEPAGRGRAGGRRCAGCGRHRPRARRASMRCSISPPRSGSASMSATCPTTPRRTMPAPPSCWPAWRAPACRG